MKLNFTNLCGLISCESKSSLLPPPKKNSIIQELYQITSVRKRGEEDSSRVFGRSAQRDFNSFPALPPLIAMFCPLLLVPEAKTAELLLSLTLLYVRNLITRSDEQKFFFFLPLRLEIYYLCIHDVFLL